uniref:Endonuclease/exonuclease/phosphatase domain-containing protein n=1 Tax=Oncorhynchus tshawytscha TaxID=74940 RepID=A0A8C8IRA5_ONCTS
KFFGCLEHNPASLCHLPPHEFYDMEMLSANLDSRRTGMKPDGCVGVYKKDCLSLLSSHPVEYFRRGIPLLDRGNLGLVLLLRPMGPFSPEACLAQLTMLLAEITTVSRLSDGSSYPTVLYGDFNSVPWSPLYNFVRESSLEYDSIPICKVRASSSTCPGLICSGIISSVAEADFYRGNIILWES